MAELNATLESISESTAEKIPDEAMEAMHRATQDLVDSGQADRAIGVDDRMPRFEATTAAGRAVTSDELLGPGPLILTFFRGHW